jgi:tetratricopeptide (TPR) repeat protein
MKIFISYPHQPIEHAQLVERIISRLRSECKADGTPLFEKVWFDNDHLLAGGDWPQCIVDGILESDWTIAFLSRHSLRDPGVCLKEIGLSCFRNGGAGVLGARLEQIDRLPIAVAHVQTIDLDDWAPTEGKEYEHWFDAKYTTLLDAIQLSGAQQRSSELNTISRAFNINTDLFDSLFEKHLRGFVGRQWLFDSVENWARTTIGATNEYPLFVLTGGPGMGKSAWAANLAHQPNTRVVGFYFVEHRDSESQLARRVVTTFIRQMAFQMADFRRVLLHRLGLPIGEREVSDEAILIAQRQLNALSPAQLCKQFLVEVGHRSINRSEKLLLVLDGLDEASRFDFKSGVWHSLLADDAMFANQTNASTGTDENYASCNLIDVFRELPPWLGVVITSRPEAHLLTVLEEFNPTILVAEDANNREDLGRWVAAHPLIISQHAVEQSALVTALLDRSAGNFRFAQTALQALSHKGRFTIADITALPASLASLYRTLFSRQFPDLIQYHEKIAPVLGWVATSSESLPINWVARWEGWSKLHTNRFKLLVGSILDIIMMPRLGECLRPFHRTVSEWLECDAAGHYQLDMACAKLGLAQALWQDESLALQSATEKNPPADESATNHALTLLGTLMLASPPEPFAHGDPATCALRKTVWDAFNVDKAHKSIEERLSWINEWCNTPARRATRFVWAIITCQWTAQQKGALSLPHGFALARLANAHYTSGDYSSGLAIAQYLRDLLSQYENCEDDGLALIANAAAEGLFYAGDYETAEALCHRIFAIGKESNRTNSSCSQYVAPTFELMANIRYFQDRIDESVDYLDRARECFQSKGEVVSEASCHGRLAYTYYYARKHAEARFHYNSAKCLLESSGADRELALLLKNAGSVTEGRHAIPGIKQAIEIFDRIDEPYLQSCAYNNLGVEQFIDDNLNDSIVSSENAISGMHDAWSRVNAPINNLAICRLVQGSYDEANQLLVKARELSYDGWEVAAVENNLAVCMAFTGRFEEAERLCQQVGEYVKKSNDPTVTARIHSTLCGIKLAKKVAKASEVQALLMGAGAIFIQKEELRGMAVVSGLIDLIKAQGDILSHDLKKMRSDCNKTTKKFNAGNLSIVRKLGFYPWHICIFE